MPTRSVRRAGVAKGIGSRTVTAVLAGVRNYFMSQLSPAGHRRADQVILSTGIVGDKLKFTYFLKSGKAGELGTSIDG